MELMRKEQSKEDNCKGLDFLFEGNIDEAINSFDSSISLDSYYSLAHYNKRIALSMKEIRDDLVQSMSNLSLRSSTVETCFVISTISYVPGSHSSDSDSDSSDSDSDSSNSNFQILVKKIDLNKKYFPFTIKKHKDVNIHPVMYEDTSDTDVSEDINIARFLGKLHAQGFEKCDNGKQSNIGVSIALNRMKSLSKRKNKSLLLAVRSKICRKNTEIKCEKFGFSWDYKWYNHEGNPVDYNTVRTFYKQLKKHDKTIAKKFLEQEEGNFERNPANIPYQILREYAKNHEKTKALVRGFREQNSDVNIYLSLIDDDVVDFNGVYSAYLRIVRGCYKVPTVMTTGYEFSRDPEYCQAYEYFSQKSRMIRVITTFYVPLGTYYPEPNMCILIPKEYDTLPESFIDSKRGNGLESPILIYNIQKRRPGATYIFSEDKAIIIEIPPRAKVYKAPRACEAEKLEFSPEFSHGPASPSKTDFKSYGKVAQSDFKCYNWYCNLFINNSVKYDSNYHNASDEFCFHSGCRINVYQQCKSIISKLYKSAENQALLKEALSNRITSSNTVDGIVQAVTARKEYDKFCNEYYLRHNIEDEVVNIIRDKSIDITTVPKEAFSVLSCKPVPHEREKDEASPGINVTDLIQLDAEVLEMILNNSALLEALVNHWEEMMKMLTEHFEEFLDASELYHYEEILEKFSENPLHLAFMAGDPTEIVYMNSDDEDIVTFGRDYYYNDLDLHWIMSELGENSRELFKILMGFEN